MPRLFKLKINYLGVVMKKIIGYLLLFSLASCSSFVAGNISKERKHLYEYNNNQEYCDKNPNRCVNNIPWS